MATKTANELKIYQVINRDTGELQYSVSNNAEDACKQVGWLIDDCYVIEQKPKLKMVKGENRQPLYRIPCQVCPFNYTECKNPAGEECPFQPTTPEIEEYQECVAKSHFCPHLGQDLAITDHRLNQKWLPIAEAIKELSAQRQREPPNASEPTC